MSNPPPDCLRCGACCHSPAERFVRVTGADWARLGDMAERVAHFTGRGNEAYMRMTAGHCIALEIRPGTGADATPDYFCTLYDRRPQICRDLARGSPECAGERAGRNGSVGVGGASLRATDPARSREQAQPSPLRRPAPA